jgi:glycosyltransferase involved in cell wall biosynthesis
MAEAYSLADLFVFPSRTENYPLSVLESIACSTPAAAFRVGGIPEIITVKSLGLLAKPFSRKELTKNIKSILNRKEVKLSAPKEYSIKKAAKEYLKLFREVLS